MDTKRVIYQQHGHWYDPYGYNKSLMLINSIINPSVGEGYSSQFVCVCVCMSVTTWSQQL